MSVDPDMLLQALMAQGSKNAVGKVYPQLVENDNAGMPNKLDPSDADWMQFITNNNLIDLPNHAQRAKRLRDDEDEANINGKSMKWNK